MSHTQPRRPAFGRFASALVLAFTAVLTLAPAVQAATAPWLNVEKYAGVGVWRKDGVTYLVVDFYTP
jgi:hypothetical protein